MLGVGVEVKGTIEQVGLEGAKTTWSASSLLVLAKQNLGEGMGASRVGDD
jgi:hypothetical protein